MNRDVQQVKQKLRATIRAELSAVRSETRAVASEKVCRHLLAHPVWQKAGAILFYSPLQDELDISPLWLAALQAGKTIALPRFLSETEGYVACELPHLSHALPPGKFGIAEPGSDSRVVPVNQLDLVLVPGVAFDMTGHRLGRGKGFYDRLLETAPGTKCGVAYDEQVRPEIPVEPHDVVLNYLVTPSRWFNFSPRTAST